MVLSEKKRRSCTNRCMICRRVDFLFLRQCLCIDQKETDKQIVDDHIQRTRVKEETCISDMCAKKEGRTLPFSDMNNEKEKNARRGRRRNAYDDVP